MPRDGMKKAKGSSAKSKSLAGAGAGKKRSASSKAKKKLGGDRMVKQTLTRQLEGERDADGDSVLKSMQRKRNRGKDATRTARREDDMVDADGMVVDAAMSRKILAAAREQQEEVEGEEIGQHRRAVEAAVDAEWEEEDAGDRLAPHADDDDDGALSDADSVYVDDDGYMGADVGITEADEAELARFLNPERQERKTIADMIMEELARKEAGMGGIGADMDGDAMGAHETQLDPKVIHVYTELGKLLQRYKSGPLPKAFKIVPSLVDWEEIVFLMNPDDWSPVAVYAATRLFASNLNPAMAQRFYMLVLAPRISADIAANKKLNYHLYMAVKKALYKPKAFFKGLLLPLCDSRACTLREATILGSVLQKVSIPVFHASAALLIMSEMDYSGPLSIFMRVLINKKYALPYRVVDAVVNHFLRFVTDKRELPVLWHNCLLTFVQRYKAIITEEQRDLMKGLMAVHFHHLITPEVRRELFADRARGIRSFEQPDAEMAM